MTVVNDNFQEKYSKSKLSIEAKAGRWAKIEDEKNASYSLKEKVTGRLDNGHVKQKIRRCK